MKKIALLFLLVSMLGLAGCSGAKNEASIENAAVMESTPATGSKTVDMSAVGTVSGKILFEGAVPEAKQISVKGNPECAALHEGGTIPSEELIASDGKLQNVLVYVKQGLEGYTFPAPTAPHVIENKKCMYVPHVSAAMTGQEIQFLNGDSTLHNIHSYPKNSKAFNLGLPLVGMKQSRRVDTPEVAMSLKCDVHPWMSGYLAILPHPYFQVTGSDGVFTLKDLPAGDYVIEAWHEKLGVQTQNVTVAAGDAKSIDFKFTA